jgi:carbamoyl-phosphate synthase large subunit
MPKRDDIKKILVVGSGPIVIGQACEFDYSGTQACKALKEEGYEIVLVNSNPATIMTDPEFAHRTYIEPLVPEVLARIVEAERPDALLPTIGGQTGLNLAIALVEMGVLDKFGVELIGASYDAIKKAEDREMFKQAMEEIGLEIPKSRYVSCMKEALEAVELTGYPAIIRPSFTLGGTGANIAYNRQEYEEYAKWGLELSPANRVLIEESVLGWKEFELEVMRDRRDNVVIVCSIENLDPMGIHTGDSITVAPAQTLTDREYQVMRDASLAIIRCIGVDTGGSNIQFALNPENGRMVVIEMNPRVSRSSALASKATGFPIAKIAAKLAVGYTLDEIPNDITQKTPACFEPAIDYVVTKIPRFTFEKFPAADDKLGTQMKSIGEVMSIGRTFKESLQKAIYSLEVDLSGFGSVQQNIRDSGYDDELEFIRAMLRNPNAYRYLYLAEAFRRKMTIAEIHEITKIDPWFLHNIKEIIDFEEELPAMWRNRGADFPDRLRRAKEYGFSDKFLAETWNVSDEEVQKARGENGVETVYKRVDTCGAEFESYTPYLYSTYESECEAFPTDNRKIVILGGGPNRIGQGIEFDYCCVHGAFGLGEDGFETIMVNCNPETVSTDYDTSDRLYFEPLTLEHVMNIVRKERPEGVIVQFGGQTPLKLAMPLMKLGVPIIGTSPDSIDRAENRDRFRELLFNLDLDQAESGTAYSGEDALRIAAEIGYPVMVRPSYVLGGRAMEIVYDEEILKTYMREAIKVSPEHPILIDKFLQDATEVDVDAISDGETVVVAGIMEHIEEAGVHSGDSACCLPPYHLPQEIIDEIRSQTHMLARELEVVGLMNIQFAVRDGKIYVLEVNPRASRTVPFISKSIGVPLAKLAARVMAGRTLKDLGFMQERVPPYKCVKESVFPFVKFPGVDITLGPEMKSTGEVMGIANDFGSAFLKAQMAAGNDLPSSGKVFISVKDDDKASVRQVASELFDMGFKIVATRGTARYFIDHNIPNEFIRKVKEGRPHIVDAIKNNEIAMVINTTVGKQSLQDSFTIRRTTLEMGIPYCTTVEGAMATVQAIKSRKQKELEVTPLQDYHKIFI